MWFLNLHVQQVLGYDALEAGLALLPMTGAIMFLMIGVTGRTVARFGFRPPMIAGLALLPRGSRSSSPGARALRANSR